jgi:hypothetical protein
MTDRWWATFFISGGLVMVLASTLPYARADIYRMLVIFCMGLGGVVVGIAWITRSRNPRLHTWVLNVGALLGVILMYLLVRYIMG